MDLNYYYIHVCMYCTHVEYSWLLLKPQGTGVTGEQD